jgi:hypothetical protein
MRKGHAFDFHNFANQTQQLLFKQTSSLLKNRQAQISTSESKRKLQLHHEHWLSEQRLISHKLADIQARTAQQKYS